LSFVPGQPRRQGKVKVEVEKLVVSSFVGSSFVTQATGRAGGSGDVLLAQAVADDQHSTEIGWTS
jgi:hypothetical protein